MRYDEPMLWFAIGAATLMLVVFGFVWVFGRFVCPWLDKYDRGHE